MFDSLKEFGKVILALVLVILVFALYVKLGTETIMTSIDLFRNIW